MGGQLPASGTVCSLAGKYNARAGDPVQPTLSVTGLRQGTLTVKTEQRGEHRTETVKGLIDLRVSKRFTVKNWKYEAAWDLYNVLNSNAVLSINQNLGSTFGRPQTILPPRIMRFNVTARF